MRQTTQEPLSELTRKVERISAAISVIELTPVCFRSPATRKTLNHLRGKRGELRRAIIAHPDSPKQLSLFDPPIK